MLAQSVYLDRLIYKHHALRSLARSLCLQIGYCTSRRCLQATAMSLQCPTRTCYMLIEILPGQTCFVLMTLPVWLSLFFSCKCINDTKGAKWYREKVLTYAEYVFGNILKINYSNEHKGKIYTVFNYEVSPEHMYWLFIFFIQASGMALVQFWEVFLIEQSHICSTDPHLDCFKSNTNLRLNCSNITYEEQISSVTCVIIL